MKKDIERFIERAKKDLLSWLKRPSSKDQSMTFNVLIKEEDDILVAHCLEFDIVATADSLKQVKEDISSFQVIIFFQHGTIPSTHLILTCHQMAGKSFLKYCKMVDLRSEYWKRPVH